MKVITIGRSVGRNDIVVNDDKVSRIHLQLVEDDQGNFSVVDLNSTNGTFVNGHRITGETKLNSTDELRIGNTVLPWQSYFSRRSNTEIDNLISSQPQASPQSPIVDRAPNRWLIYVIVGVVALLLTGGGLGGMIYHNNKQLEKAKKDLEIAQGAFDAALLDYNEKVAKAKETNTSEDIEAAEAAAANVAEKQKNLSAAQTGVENASRIKGAGERKPPAQNSSRQQGVGENPKGGQSETQPSQAEKGQAQPEKSEPAKEAERPSANNGVSLTKPQEAEPNNNFSQAKKERKKNDEEATSDEQLNQRIESILEKWTDNDAYQFCKNHNWGGFSNKKEAKGVIRQAYSLPNQKAKRENMVAEMEQWDASR